MLTDERKCVLRYWEGTGATRLVEVEAAAPDRARARLEVRNDCLTVCDCH